MNNFLNLLSGRSSYHFIPIFLPHSHYSSVHHYYPGSRSNSGSSSDSSTSSSVTNSSDEASIPTATTPPITAPILLNMNQPFEAGDGESTSSDGSLIVAVKNMLIYAAMEEDKHLTLVIDEDVEQPFDIPEEFLHHKEDEDVELSYVLPSLRTTTESSTDQLLSSTTIVAVKVHQSTVAPTASNVSLIDAMASAVDESSQVMNNRWFSDIDGGTK